MAGIASCLIVFASWRRGAPRITLTRMVANILLETTIGAIPAVGDIFHIAWKANRRNYRLLVPRERATEFSHRAGLDISRAPASYGDCRGRDTDRAFDLDTAIARG